MTIAERFIFLHVVVNSAMTFFSSKGGVKRSVEDFVQLLVQGFICSKNKNERCMLNNYTVHASRAYIWGHHGNDMQTDQHRKNKRQSFPHDVPEPAHPERELGAEDNTIGGKNTTPNIHYITKTTRNTNTQVC